MIILLFVSRSCRELSREPWSQSSQKEKATSSVCNSFITAPGTGILWSTGSSLFLYSGPIFTVRKRQENRIVRIILKGCTNLANHQENPVIVSWHLLTASIEFNRSISINVLCWRWKMDFTVIIVYLSHRFSESTITGQLVNQGVCFSRCDFRFKSIESMQWRTSST